MTTRDDISNALDKLGLLNASIVVHSSLKSFGLLEGGPDTFIEELISRCRNVMMPAFSTTFITRPPEYDRPAQNGCDYEDESLWKLNCQDPFDFTKLVVDPRMGAIARRFAERSDVFRSTHPWHGWAAWGQDAEAWTADHPWNKTHSPLEKLVESGGSILLAGVDLTSCTAIHLAEERVGRKPFIRWARNSCGEIERICVSGCAKGFNQIGGLIFPETTTSNVSVSNWQLINAQRAIDVAAKKMRETPTISICRPTCLRCKDAVLGGPMAMSQSQ